MAQDVTEDKTRSGASPSRVVVFDTTAGWQDDTTNYDDQADPVPKTQSWLQIVWSDSFQCGGTGARSCQWEVQVDDLACSNPGPIKYVLKASGGIGR